MNKNTIVSFLLLVVGTSLGAVGGYLYGKNKYLAMADREIASVKKVYEKHFNQKKETPEPKTEFPEKGQVISAPATEEKRILEEAKDTYKKYAATYKSGENGSKIESIKSSIKNDQPAIEPKKAPAKLGPRVITPDEFQDSDYEAETLIWYSDKVLADSDGNVIHDINGLIGPEALTTFGRYADDVVYVRDDSKRIDYEIIWDARKYSSVNNESND